MPVPLLDLTALHAPLRGEIADAVDELLLSSALIGGPAVESFEREFAAYVGSDTCLGVSSGTEALRLGMLAAGIGPGDEVVTTGMTFIATVAAVLAVGATPVLVDPDPVTGLIGPAEAATAICPRTAALAPVHLYGQPVDLVSFRELADRSGLLLIEDACQAHGASRDGLRAGAVGDFAAFSFYPGKNLGALGDGGALTTSRPDIAERVSRLRDHGRSGKYLHSERGCTARLDAIQAAVLSIKLRHLDSWNARRRAHAAAFDAALDELGIDHIVQELGAESVYHQYVLLSDDRDRVASELAARGIGTGIHYPIPMHEQPALQSRVRVVGETAGADRLAARCLSIPVGPELHGAAVEEIISAIASIAPATRDGDLAGRP